MDRSRARGREGRPAPSSPRLGAASAISAAFAGIARRQLLEQSELDRERHQLLLRPVVDVAFELASFLVLRGDQPLAGRAELLDQPHVPQDQARLRREVAHQSLLRRVDRIVRRHRHRQGAEELAPILDLDGAVRRQPRDATPAHRDRRRLRAVGPDDPRGPELVPDVEPDDGIPGPHGVGEDPRHPGQDVLGRVRAADPIRELREDLVGRRATPVDDPIGDPTRQPDDGPEREADRDRPEDRERVRFDERPRRRGWRRRRRAR